MGRACCEVNDPPENIVSIFSCTSAGPVVGHCGKRSNKDRYTAGNILKSESTLSGISAATLQAEEEAKTVSCGKYSRRDAEIEAMTRSTFRTMFTTAVHQIHLLHERASEDDGAGTEIWLVNLTGHHIFCVSAGECHGQQVDCIHALYNTCASHILRGMYPHLRVSHPWLSRLKGPSLLVNGIKISSCRESH